MNTLETLIAARELISKPENWTQDIYASNSEGEAKEPTDNSATCFCSLGAIAKITGKNRQDPDFNAVERAIEETIDNSVAKYNDTHTHEEVLAVFDKTIERLKGQL